MTLTIRWIARGLSVLVLLFVLVFLVGEGLSGRVGLPDPAEWLMLLFFPIGLMVGLGIAWRQELLGGIIGVLSMGMFYLINFWDSGLWPRGPFFFLLMVPAVLFIWSGWVEHQDRQVLA